MLKAVRKNGLVRDNSVRNGKVYQVAEVMKVIHGRDNPREEPKFWPLTPSRIATAEQNGDPIIKIARLEKANHLHQDGSKTCKRGLWVPVTDVTVIQRNDEGLIDPPKN